MFAYNCRGLTLIELLIALAISLFMLATLVVVYASTEKNQQLQTALNGLQENARAALQLLHLDIDRAGNIGCARLQRGFPLKNFPPYELSPQQKIFGTENSITIRGASVESAGLVVAMRDDKTLYVAGAPRFKAGEIALIANCGAAEIFVVASADVSHVSRQKVVAKQALSQRYGVDAEVSAFEENTFFVSDTGRRDIAGKPVWALSVKNIAGDKTELVEGVKEMRVKFDVAMAGKLVMKTAGEVADWSQVVGVQITLVMEAVNGYSLQKTWQGYFTSPLVGEVDAAVGG